MNKLKRVPAVKQFFALLCIYVFAFMLTVGFMTTLVVIGKSVNLIKW